MLTSIRHFFSAIHIRNFQKTKLTKIQILFLIFLIFFSTRNDYAEEFSSEFQPVYLPSPNKKEYEEQIKCQVGYCREILYTEDGKYMEEVWTELGKNGGKVVVNFLQSPMSLSESKMDGITEYLREITKRDGHVSFEPFYIATRGIGMTEVPVVKDLFGLSYNIYKRIRSLIVFGRMEHYNAKVLFHPTNGKILQVFFFHKNYGNLCETVYSTCDRIEYMDDELFDKQLSLRLSESKHRGIEISFSQTPAVLPTAKLDLNHLLDTNRSARLYKWLIVSKKTETKTVTKERFLTLGLAIKTLDYTLSAYELLETIQLYLPVRSKQAEVTYEDTEDGKQVRSVIFYPLPNLE
jgi:hypothetical protein